jgi:DMSO/TMAO reductase YedYZ molybdopterin-dependent catalytic subunit
MNGDDLPSSHGFPLRAVVGGWYGMASVKWLTRIVVTDKPYAGYWQTISYSVWNRKAGLPELRPVTVIQPKASIARPALGEVVPAGKDYLIRGAAWTGEGKVTKVEVSSDGGRVWAQAHLTGEDKPFCWRTWQLSWLVPEAKGPTKLLARATTDAGATQPEKRDPDRRSYMINHLVPVEVIVR